MTTLASLRERTARVARTIPFRVVVAVVCLSVQLGVLIHSGASRFGAPFNAAPGHPPDFANPAADGTPRWWNRLVVSRWDAGSYIALGLRGYQYCPPRRPGGALPPSGGACNLTFYPTYGLVGRLATFGGRVPIDFALLAVSLLASGVFIFLWTGDALVRRLGLLDTYVALLLLNVFTTGFALVTVQTEPLTLALTLGAFVAVSRGRWLPAALLAGAASAMRITAVAVSLAAGVALIVDTWQRRPTALRGWAYRAALLVLCGWGALALAGYHLYRFGDALTYVHAHARDFKHDPSLWSIIAPRPEWVIRSLEYPLHDGVFLAGALLWFLIGHREALGRFPPSERAFWYALFFGTVGIAAVGMAPIGFAGMNRYLLLALPLFFTMAVTMRPRPALLALWIVFSAWHYWNVDSCYYTGGQGNRVLGICHAPHWIGRL